MKYVSKIYGNNVTALSNISFSICKGEFVFVVGPSGAGKSTLVKMIYREETPTSGTVVVNGVDLGRMRRRDVPRLRRTIGVVFQDFKLLPDRTVFENVAFALRVIEASKREIRRKVPAVLEMVGLGERSSDMPHHLSGGEQQRVALARAVVNNPSVIIADEPTGNLDPDTSWGIVALLSEVNRRGTTVIMATHDKPIVDSMRKRVIQMEGGSVVRDTPHGVYGHAV
jgi:cell division transport system ATP-binding protein